MTDKKIPLYLKEIYGDFYNNQVLYEWMDKPWIQTLMTLGANHTLYKALNKEITAGEKVLQLGCTFGNQIEETAEKVGIYGIYDILDVSNIQLKRCKEKYGNFYPQIRYIRRNANSSLQKNYDVVILYMLLHEVPHRQKTKIIQAALDSLREGGKAVIIDYHEPAIWYPLRWPIKLFNRLYQPLLRFYGKEK